MIRIKVDRSWKRQLMIRLKVYLKFRGYWYYCIVLIIAFVLMRIFLYQHFPGILKMFFYPVVFLVILFPCLVLEVYWMYKNLCFRGEGDVWRFFGDDVFGRESDFVKVTLQWNNVDTITEKKDAFYFTKGREKICLVDKCNLSTETIYELRESFLWVPVENVELLK